PTGQLKRDFVLTKSPVINSLGIRTMRGFDHDVGIFHKLEMLAARAAFFNLIEHRRWLQQCTLLIRYDALLDRIRLSDLHRIPSVDNQSCGGTVAAILMAYIRRYDEDIAFGQLKIAFGCLGYALVLDLNLCFTKSRRPASVCALGRSAMH